MNDFQLQSPGAGLPFVELWISKWIVLPSFYLRHSWADAVQLFQAEGEKVLELVERFGEEKQDVPILIPRIVGIEDSSRNWSPAMVMEHLRIVGMGMGRIILSLSQGQRPPGKASTATVKPARGISATEFQVFLEQFWVNMDTQLGDRNSPLTFEHPWFGELDLQRWQRLLALHQGIHRRQLEQMWVELTKK